MKKQCSLRLLSLMLALVMVLSMTPANVNASGQTIAADPVTVIHGQNAAPDRDNSFNMDWKFYLGNNDSASGQNFNDSGWDDVNLPHDFSITQHFTTSGEAESGFMPGGTGWYRKSFVLSPMTSGKTFLLNFDGAYKDTYVYVNGSFVGEHHYGYSSFAFDITDYLVCDGATQNVIAVKVVNQLPSSRWYSGSGIYRDVTLYALDPVHVDLNGVFVTTPDLDKGDSTANVRTTVVNDGRTAVSATVTSTVTAKGSADVLAADSSTISVEASSSAEATTAPVVPSPKLWSVDSPNLYTLTTEVTVNGVVVDTCSTDFGYRWFSWSAQGFALNGNNVKLNGVCLHHDQGGLGAAAYYDAMYRQLSIMKEMGCNAIRTSHNPADEQFIQICSELGLLVIEEHFDGITQAKNGNSNDFAKYFTQPVDAGLYGAEAGMLCSEYVVRSIVRRDRNAAAVFAWSYGNEIQEGNYVNDPDYATYSLKYIDWINEEDGTRIATIGDNSKASGYSYVNQTLRNILDAGGVVGFNYHCHQSDSQSLLNNWGGQWGCILASETSSHTNSRGQYRNQNNNSSSDDLHHLTSYDTSAVGWGDPAHDSMYDTLTKDYIAGEFVWTGFDYIGEPTPWNGINAGSVTGGSPIPNSSYFGIVETTGFPKDSYWLYRAQWNKADTTVHLVTAWDSDNMLTSGGKTPVWVYSNAHKVELYLNDALIGTTVRTPITTAAGHTYYTYAPTSNNTSVCTAQTGYNADSLYSVFNVAYTAGTLKAVAYDENNNELDTYSVSTPGTVTQLKASANRATMAADGQSLVYVEIDVTDVSGNLKTTATNNITFTLTGPGEIAAVDNGDQSTIRKYQNPYVLIDRATANINAYAGKALIIIRSTEEAGQITLNIASSGLKGQTITINTTPTGNSGSESEGLVSYTMVQDYTVKAGTVPALNNESVGTFSDGSTIAGTITWDTVSEAVYGHAGDHTIRGTLSFPGHSDVNVAAKLHVIPNVIDLRNVSTATALNTAPTLPSTVLGVEADGTLSGEFPVVWERTPDAGEFTDLGAIVTVTGTAVIFGDETMDVTCSIRAAQPIRGEGKNVATAASGVEQDIPAGFQSDNLNSIIDGTRSPSGDSTDDRWTNWDYRNTRNTAALTLRWDTAQIISDINLFYRYDSTCDKPAQIVFSYSLDGVNFTDIAHTETELNVTVNLGAAFTYALAETINPIAVRVTLTQQNSKCLGLYEFETITYATTMEPNTSADLSGISVDGTAIPGFAADTLAYEADGSTVTATTAVNAGITVLPAFQGVVRILTVSEDGSAARTYEVTVADACTHSDTELRNAAAATCTDPGYSGDTVCTECGYVVSTGSVISSLGHKWSDWDVTTATCTDDGVRTRTCIRCPETETEVLPATGHSYGAWVGSEPTCDDAGVKTSTCSGCGDVRTQTTPAAGHKWNSGVITQEPTETADGIKTFTCTVCGATKTESVEYQAGKKAPTVSLTLSKTSAGKIVINGKVDDYANLDKYYEITAHGIVYIQTSKIGTRTLTINTSGRTKVNFTSCKDDGSYSYSFTPTAKTTSYTFRAFITYKDTSTGKTVTVYSNVMRCSYNGISQ